MVLTLVRRSAFSLSLVGLFCIGQLPAQSSTVTELSKRLERHRRDIEAVKLAGSPYLMHFLFTGMLFEGSKGVDDLNPEAVEAEKALLAATIKEGITPIGAMKVWTFPEFAGAQRYGDGHSEWFSTPVFIPQCVPEFQDPEYARLRAIRSQMFATVARTFSEIPVWLIGPEAEPKFFDCYGTELSLENHLRFVVDTLEDLSTAIKSVNSSASIVGHFLGDRWHLLKIDGQQLQPSEMLALIQQEIRSRGKPTELYYDLFVHELDPVFLADRFEEDPVPIHGRDIEEVKQSASSTYRTVRPQRPRSNLAAGPYLMHFLFTGTLFEGSGGVDDLNPEAVEAEKALLAATIKEGITPIGAMKVWTFPEFAGAQRYGDGHSEWFSTPVFIPQCVPEFQDPEYARLRAIRSQMFATVARTFSEIPVWLIGPEPEPKFFDCDSTELSLEDHLRFVVDTLEDLSTAIKSVNSSASIVGHFLGDRWHLLKIDGQQLQPSEMLALIQEEIRSRGKPTELYYDLFVHELDPIFLADRFEEEPVPTGFGGSALLGGCTDCWGDPVWEDFNTNADDLADEYDAWIDIQTDLDRVLLTDIEVTGGEALLRLEDPDPEETSAAGARSEPTEVDFVPNESFGTSADGQAKNLWTAVSDFYPTDEPISSPGAHPAICTRVNERIWSGEEDQTRFCSIVPSLEVTRTGFGCSNGGGTTSEKIGAAQFTGDANAAGTTGITYLSCFSINALVYDNPGDLHRVEIQEEERRGCVFCSFTKYWKADLYNLDDQSFLGSSGWISEFVFTSTPVYSIPSLSEQILFAYAPGIDGGIDAERVGTTYWVYAE